jgi:hypothetical protein
MPHSTRHEFFLASKKSPDLPSMREEKEGKHLLYSLLG